MTAVTELDLLTTWEAALPRPRRERALLLAGLVGGPEARQLADLPLGEVDLLLLELRERCFGPLLDCLVTCPHCGEDLDASVDVSELRLPAAEEDVREVSVGGRALEVRAVTTSDLLATGDRASLIRRCVTRGDVDEEALSLVENVLDQLDPQAAPTVELDCPACRGSWLAPFDVADFVWSEIDRTARRTLFDVHALATAYGWTEDAVLALTPLRRSYYLQAAAT